MGNGLWFQGVYTSKSYFCQMEIADNTYKKAMPKNNRTFELACLRSSIKLGFHRIILTISEIRLSLLSAFYAANKACSIAFLAAIY